MLCWEGGREVDARLDRLLADGTRVTVPGDTQPPDLFAPSSSSSDESASRRGLEPGLLSKGRLGGSLRPPGVVSEDLLTELPDTSLCCDEPIEVRRTPKLLGEIDELSIKVADDRLLPLLDGVRAAAAEAIDFSPNDILALRRWL